MFTPFPRLLVKFLALVCASAATLHAEPEIIAKARAYLGSEAALNSVKSVHYSGTVTASNAADPTTPLLGTIEIIFQAPYRQRTNRTSGALFDTVALDNYDGWHRMGNVKEPAHWRLQLLPAEQVKRQRAIVQENLSFFRGLERAGGKVEDLGSTTLDGVTCRKIAFIHSADVIFYRYFDEATGQIRKTETESGNTIREEGEIQVDGIRFPKVIINTIKAPNGSEQTITITFDKITLNQAFPDDTFAVPTLLVK